MLYQKSKIKKLVNYKIMRIESIRNNMKELDTLYVKN